MSSSNDLFILSGQEEYEDPYEWDGMPEFEQPDAEAPFMVKVRFRNLEDVKAFGEAIGQPRLGLNLDKLKRNNKSTWYPEAEYGEGGNNDLLRWIDEGEEDNIGNV
jgi:hypothetical protein